MATKPNTAKRSENSGTKKKSSPKKGSSAKSRRRKKTGDSVPFYRQERYRKIAGLTCLLIASFLLVSFISYCFTWKLDNDLVYGKNWSVIFDGELKVNNALGRLGAITSYFFFSRWFGIASFAIVGCLILTGLRLLYAVKRFRLRRVYLLTLLGILWFSTGLAFIFPNAEFPWGGALGKSNYEWLSLAIGRIGTGMTLAFAAIAWGVFTYNFSLRPTFPNIKGRNPFSVKDDGTVEWHDTDEDSMERQAPTYNTAAEELGTPLEVKAKPAPETVLPKVEKTPPLETETPAKQEVKANNAPSDSTATAKPSDKDMAKDKQQENSDWQTVESRKPTKKPATDQDLELDIVEDASTEEDKPQQTRGSLGTNYDPTLDLPNYKYPRLELLEEYENENVSIDTEELERNKDQIIETLSNYKIQISKIKATIGPTVTLYEIVPAPGVRISKIKNLEDDIALSLAALGIRIIAPIPGKGTIGIEVPNVNKEIVSMKSVLASPKFTNAKMDLPICLGKTIASENYIADLARMPHLLVAGATGQGKSVGINAILVSLLYKKHPSQLKFVLIDPKKVELSLFQKIEQHYLAKLPGEEEPIITDTRKVVATLNSLCIEMDERYDLLKKGQVRNIKEYNQKFINRKLNPENGHRFLPFIVLVIDEFADLIMTAGKEVEMPIARLAQLARAIGIHLVIATQRPSVNIITGTIKANFPARIAFKVTSKVDSRTILDTGGAEQLIGRGDMLLSIGGNTIRLQCPFVDTPEVENVADFIGDQKAPAEPFILPEYIDEKDTAAKSNFGGERDALFEDAARIVVMNQQGSTSLIQRRLKLGYNRAGRLMDQLEAAGIVGPNAGSKAREVLYQNEMELEQFLQNND